MADNKETLLQADSSPAALVKQSGVRRVNNLPVMIVGGLMTLFLISMVVVAMDRSKQHEQSLKTGEEKAESSQLFAKEIAGTRADGIIQSKTGARGEANPAPAYGPELLKSGSTDRNAELPLIPPLEAYPPPPNLPSPEDEAANRIRLLKLQQLDEAVRAKTAVNLVRQGPHGNLDTPANQDGDTANVREQLASRRDDDATASYQSGLALLKGASLSEGNDPHAAANIHQGMAPFDQAGTPDRWKLDNRMQPPRSPYELRAGFVVPATLISGINSELPGQIMGQVAQNVFDTATGKYLLIPQGARLVGTYSSTIGYGQARVLIAWQRIIYPDGKALDIGAMPGADGAGYAGFNDQVNNHYLRIFGSAFLMSGVVAGITLSQPPQQVNAAPTVSSAMSQALGQELGSAAAQMISKNMTIAPTLDIRAGYRFNVIVTKDMTFAKPYQSFDY